MVFRTGAVLPEQILRFGKFGTVIPTTVMLNVTVVFVTHSPALGMKVYVCVPMFAKLTTFGFQVPWMPFCEIAGRTGTFGSLWH